MAYIHKMTVYFVDPNEKCSVDDIEEIIRNDDYLPSMCIAEAETKSFKWDDEVVVNRIDAPVADYEKFFNNLK